MRSTCYSLIILFSLFMAGCHSKENKQVDMVADNTSNAIAHYTVQTDVMEQSEKMLTPRTIDERGNIVYVSYANWTSGFFPGSLWYLYHLTADSKWEALAVKYTEALDSAQYLTTHHDIGFIIGCSYLNGMRLAKIEYKEMIQQSARSLATRFRPNAEIIQSWDADKGWQALRGWKCPVIIDNMMNLELLFEATRLSGDSTYYNMAVSHADQTLENHFRPNHSCYHVVDYDPETGHIRSKETAQGYADESAWARGQAWALYGFTVCYRYTHHPAYLEQAQRVYDFIFTNRNLPNDLIPYWDFNALNIPNEPRDVSAATIVASALYELSGFAPNGNRYKETADKMLAALSTPTYMAEPGSNGNFLLKHSVGSIPHGAEIDVPLNYADYYFLEALVRKRDIEKKRKK